MAERVGVGVIGATGVVGQNYIRLLSQNPWFEVVYVAASPRSAGKRYQDALAGRWHMPVEVPERTLPTGKPKMCRSSSPKSTTTIATSSLFKEGTMDGAEV
jgi:aspartate-semialdehyde dehydrogenase